MAVPLEDSHVVMRHDVLLKVAAGRGRLLILVSISLLIDEGSNSNWIQLAIVRTLRT